MFKIAIYFILHRNIEYKYFNIKQLYDQNEI